jgi:protein SCO1/2
VKSRPVLVPLLVGALLVLPLLAVTVTLLARHRVTQIGSSRLPTLGAVTGFSLVDANERPAGLDNLKGRVWLASFIFTRCAGACPIMMHQIKQLQSELDARDDFKFVSITVDPEWDMPKVLTEYAATYGADRSRWLFLTGEKSQIQRLAREAFHLTVDEAAGVEEEPILHSSKLVLVDRNGLIRGYYDGTDTEALEQLKRDLRRLLAERS